MLLQSHLWLNPYSNQINGLAFKSIQDGGWSFMTNLADTQEHVPEADHNNHFLKKCICTTYHGIPYKMLPQTVVCYMAMETTAMLNYFLVKGGCSNLFSPREILHHVKLNYKKHVLCLFLVMFLLTMNQPLPTLFVHVHWIVWSYALFKPSKVGMSVIIILLASSLQ